MRKMRTLTEEHKRKISDSLKGRKCRTYFPLSEEHKKKISVGLTAYMRCPEVRKRISVTSTGKTHTEATKAKIRQSHLGLIVSDDTRAKLSAYRGEMAPFYGRKHTEKTRQLRSNQMMGSNNYNWQGGKSFDPYTPVFNRWLKKEIRNRDNCACQLCHVPENGRKHDVHHIDYVKDNCHPLNLIALCRSCNGKVNFNRGYWTNYFQGLAEVKYGLTG